MVDGGSTAAEVESRVLRGGERLWSLDDFAGLPAGATARALSRLAARGVLERQRKGVYWRSRETVVGSSVPAAGAVMAQAARAPLQPAGLTAASFLGLTTQNPMRPEFATSAAAVPRGVAGAIVHTRRPAARVGLNATDAALLEVLRDRGRTSDLTASETAERLTHLLGVNGRYVRLADAATDEPPRVRAMLGALGEQAGAPSDAVDGLRRSLNPLSTFDFGLFGALPNARAWQAR